ncbi:MAG: toxin-antitoxin system YwqK family antitoxin [Phycisphaerae bacterium]
MEHAHTPESPRMGRSRIRRILVGLIPVVVLCGYLGYLWFVSGVLPSVDRYPDGTIKSKGYVSRYRFGVYHKTGRWVTYHPNGVMASDGFYEDGEKTDTWKGEKVAGWRYWDEEGNEMPAAP